MNMNLLDKMEALENIDSAFYMSNESNEQFPYNLMDIRNYLKKTGKTLADVTPNELKPFLIASRKAVG